MFSKGKRATRGLSIVAAAAIALGASACGGAEGGGGGGSSDGTTTLRWWTWNPDANTAKAYIEDFEADHPKIKIEHRFIQYSDYTNTVQLGVQSGTGPDVFGTQVGGLSAQFAPLAEDLAPVAEAELGADWAEKLTGTDQLTVDGKLVGLPWMVTGGGLVWANQTMLDELELEVPATLDELRSFCAEVADAGMDCISQGAKDAWINIDVFQAISNQVAPAEFYSAVRGESDFDAPEFVQAFEIWKSLFDDGIFQEGALGATQYPDAVDVFRKGGAAMMINGTWENGNTTKPALALLQETYGEEFDVTTEYVPYAFPQVVEGADNTKLFGGPDVGFAVASNSKAKEAAQTFALWLTSSETAQERMATTVQQPALNTVPLDLGEVLTDRQKEALEAQGPALADLIGQRQIPSPDVESALGQALSAVASGQQSPEEAAAAVQTAIDSAN
jgi:raffinose/stachyose/melibiose transport system substrate-binding protein